MESASNVLNVIASVMGIGSPLLGALIFLHNQAKNFQRQKEVVKSLTRTVAELKEETAALKRDVVTKGELGRLHIELNARVSELREVSNDYRKSVESKKTGLSTVKGPASKVDQGRIIDLDEQSIIDAHSLEQRVDWLTKRERDLNDLVLRIKRVVQAHSSTIKDLQVKTK